MKKNNKLAQKRAKGEKMKVKNKTGMGFLILVCLLGLSYAGGEAWIYTNNGPANGVDVANAVDFITPSSYYAAGYTSVGLPGTPINKDLMVVSLKDSTGDTNWVYHYNGTSNDDAANAIVAKNHEYPPSGIKASVVVAGYTTRAQGDKDILVIKLDPVTGAQKWVYTYNGPGNNNDEAYSITQGDGIDSYIYVAGYSTGIGTSKDFTIIKLDTLGNQKWVYRYDGPTHSAVDDEAFAVRALSRNYYAAFGPYAIYAAGYTTGSGTGKDFTIVKLDTLGNQQWLLPYHGGYGDDKANALALCVGQGPSLALYAGGYTTGLHGKDFTVARINPNGTIGWMKTYNGTASGDDECLAIDEGMAADTMLAGVYAAGYSTNVGTGKDYTILNYRGVGGSTGTIYIYNGSANADDIAQSIDGCWNTNQDGSFYVTGYCTDSITGKDIIMTKHVRFGPTSTPWDGTAKWIYKYEGPGEDVGNALCYKGYSGSICYPIAGYTTDSTNANFTVVGISSMLLPTVPVLIAPADSAYLKDTTVTFRWHKSMDYDTTHPQGFPISYNFQYTDKLIGSDIPQRPPHPLPIWDSIITQDTVITLILNNTHGNRYGWRVKAGNTPPLNWVFWSKPSEMRVLDFDFGVPNTPVLNSPINDTFVLTLDVPFDWSSVTFKDVQTLVQYVIQIDTIPSFSNPVIQETFLVTDTIITHPRGNHYYWRVKAFDLALNESPFSEIESYRLDVNAPSIDSTTRLQNTPLIGPFNVYSKVKDMFGVDTAKLYFDLMETPTFFPRVMIHGGDWYFGEIPTVSLMNDTVKYFIQAIDKVGHVSQDPATGYYWFIANYHPGVQDFTDRPVAFSFGLESNPVKGMALFNLALPQDAFITLKIYDVSGRIVNKVSDLKSAGYYQIPWFAKTNAGVYFYTFESPGHKENGKLVIVH